MKFHDAEGERDAESGNDYFGARYYGSNVAGRFMTPDPSGLYFANPNYPQSLNLYAYVQNNPLTLTDPTGMDCIYSSGGFQPGHCTSDPNNGVDVPGTINTSSFDPTTGIFNYTYTPYDTSVGLGAGVIVFPTTNPTLSPYTTTLNNDVPLNPYAQAVLSQVGQQVGPTYTMLNKGTSCAAQAAIAGGASFMGLPQGMINPSDPLGSMLDAAQKGLDSFSQGGGIQVAAYYAYQATKSPAVEEFVAGALGKGVPLAGAAITAFQANRAVHEASKQFKECY